MTYENIPFPYAKKREGQNKFIQEVYDAIGEERSLVISAPTGLGKTISALSPALYLAKELDRKVVFLTSRQTQVNQAIATLKDIDKVSKDKFSFVAFVGKRNMCAHKDKELYPPQDFRDFCKRVREFGKCQYYINIKNSDNEEHIESVLEKTSQEFIGMEEFVDYSSRCQYCPYELSALKARKADLVICDYNYVFSPSILPSFLGRIECGLDNCIVVVDEAHNLPSRIQSSNTISLSTQVLSNALSELKDHIREKSYDNYIKALEKTFSDIYLDKLIDKKDNKIIIGGREFLEEFLQKVREETIEEVVEKLIGAELIIKEEKVVSYVGSVARFLEAYEITSHEDGFVSVFERERKKGKITLRLHSTPLDVSKFSKEVLTKVHSSVLMSATLTPLKMYVDILGLENVKCLELESPFPKRNQLTLIDRDITTKYTHRSEKTYKNIAFRIVEYLKSAQNENALLFFPSYSLMENILKHINFLQLRRKIYREQRYMSKEQKEKILNSFKRKDPFSNFSQVLFAVTQGSFSEGLDLPGKALGLVVVVGLPFAVPDCLIQAQIRYFDIKYRKGQAYGYINPTMSKIIQAGGRCIRTKNDRGVVVLMDVRFSFPNIALNFPKHWQLKTSPSIPKEITTFFSS